MTAAAILDFGNFKFLTVGTLKRIEMRPRARFCRNRGRPPSWIGFTRVGTTHEQHLVVFVTVQNLVVIGAVIHLGFPKVGGRRHLGFLKFQIFNGWDAQDGPVSYTHLTLPTILRV